MRTIRAIRTCNMNASTVLYVGKIYLRKVKVFIQFNLFVISVASLYFVIILLIYLLNKFDQDYWERFSSTTCIRFRHICTQQII